MKKWYTGIIICYCLISCTTSSKVSKSGFSEIDYVSGFINLMMHNADQPSLMNYISPEYMKENNLNRADYKVNTYSPVDFRIENYINGRVYVKIWGENRSWVHRLTFQVVKENGKLYLKPGKHTESKIDPWYRAETYLVE